MTWGRFVAVFLIAAVFAGAGDADAARKRRRKRTRSTSTKPRPTPAPRPLPAVFYGPPAPPLLRAAGSCVQVRPDFVVVAEVGQSGRAFRIDETTALKAKLARGARVRVLYVETADGPLAREILPGPVEVTPSLKPK